MMAKSNTTTRMCEMTLEVIKNFKPVLGLTFLYNYVIDSKSNEIQTLFNVLVVITLIHNELKQYMF